MKTITYEEVKGLFKRVSKYAGMDDRWFEESIKQRGLVVMIRSICTELWLKQLPETEDTQEFREQIHHLNTFGIWNLPK